jgi:hypothetical protein
MSGPGPHPLRVDCAEADSRRRIFAIDSGADSAALTAPRLEIALPAAAATPRRGADATETIFDTEDGGNSVAAATAAPNARTTID